MRYTGRRTYRSGIAIFGTAIGLVGFIFVSLGGAPAIFDAAQRNLSISSF